jgi:hypothetical protein
MQALQSVRSHCYCMKIDLVAAPSTVPAVAKLSSGIVRPSMRSYEVWPREVSMICSLPQTLRGYRVPTML